MALKIVTLALNRPDFIEIQLNSIKKWVKDFEYVVFDNCINDMVKNECDRLGIQSVKINSHGVDVSWNVGIALNQMWKTLQWETGTLVYLDSDMFLIGELPSMEYHDFAFVPQKRKNDVTYPWTGLMLFNMDTLPFPEELRWEVYYELKDTDVGGRNHYYLVKHAPKVLELEMWTVIDKGKYSFNGTDTDIHHENYDKMESMLQDFPHPYSVDMFKTKDSSFDKCFVFHYKSGSNYPQFCTPEYNVLKTAALNKLLCKMN